MKTVKEFPHACALLDSAQILDLFENRTAAWQRDELFYFADADVTEPVKYVFNKLGRWSGVQSLIDY